MNILLSALATLAVAGLTSLSAPAPSAGAAAPTVAQGGGVETITVQIQTRGAPDKPITWGGGDKKTRCFRLYCAESYFHPITSICVEFESGITALELAEKFRAEVQRAIDSPDCLEYCDYTVKVSNNALMITGRGAGKFAGVDEPEYEGERGDDLTDDYKPKNNPLCRLAISLQ